MRSASSLVVMWSLPRTSGQLANSPKRPTTASRGRPALSRRWAYRRHQLVGGVQADHLQQLRVVVGFDQRQAVRWAPWLAASATAASSRPRKIGRSRPGGGVALLQLLDLARQFRVHVLGLAAEDHLLAGRLRIARAVNSICRGSRCPRCRARSVHARGGGSSPLTGLSRALNCRRPWARITGRAGIPSMSLRSRSRTSPGRPGWRGMHALVDRRSARARSRSARRSGAGLASALQARCRQRRVEVVPFGADVLQNCWGQPQAMGPARPRPASCTLSRISSVTRPSTASGTVAAAAHHHHRHFVERHPGVEACSGQHHVEPAAGPAGWPVRPVVRAQRAHRDAGIAQAADGGLGLVDLVVPRSVGQVSCFTYRAIAVGPLSRSSSTFPGGMRKDQLLTAFGCDRAGFAPVAVAGGSRAPRGKGGMQGRDRHRRPRMGGPATRNPAGAGNTAARRRRSPALRRPGGGIDRSRFPRPARSGCSRRRRPRRATIASSTTSSNSGHGWHAAPPPPAGADPAGR